MGMTDILLIDGYHGTNWNLVLARCFLKQGISVCICTNNIAFYHFYKKNNVDAEYVRTNNIFGILKSSPLAGISDFHDFSATEHSYYQLPEWYNKNVSRGYLKSIKRILDKRRPKMIFQGQGGELLRRIFFKEAKDRGILCLFSGESMLKEKLAFYQDEHKTPYNNINGSNDIDLHSLFNEIISSKKVIKYSSKEIDYPVISPIKKFITSLLYVNYHPVITSIAHKFLLKNVYKKYLNNQIRLDLQKDIENEDFYFFPLNVPAESELFIRNPKFADQLDTLKNISNNLPKGIILYVKQHPGLSGVINDKMAAELDKIENIRLIKTEYNTFDIVKKSNGVIMVSSSVGFEAYLLEKPVIVLGSWPYTELADFIKINDYEDIPMAIQKAQRCSPSIKPTEFMRNIESRSFDGNLHRNNDMIKKVSHSLSRVLQDL